MCGRYATPHTDAAVLRERFGVQQRLETFTPSKNIKPTQDAPVVIARNDEHALADMRWSLTPS